MPPRPRREPDTLHRPHPIRSEHPKLSDLVHTNFFDYSAIEPPLTGFDACLFTFGVFLRRHGRGKIQAPTYDLTLTAATTLARLNPKMTFLYLSGAGTDSTERGRTMWARAKGKTENGHLKLPFRAAYMFPPGIIQPMHGIRSKTKLYQTLYTILNPILPLLKSALSKHQHSLKSSSPAAPNETVRGLYRWVIVEPTIKA